MIDLLDDDGARDKVLAALKSREWWLIPLIGETGMAMSTAIEETFFAGEKNRHFELLVGGQFLLLGFAGFALAKKSILPRVKLARFMAARATGDGKIPATVWAEQLKTRDVLVSVGDSPGEREHALRILPVVNTWLDGA